MINEFLNYIKNTKSDNTYVTYKNCLKTFFPEGEAVLTPQGINKAIARLKEKGISNNTIANYLAIIKSFAKYADRYIGEVKNFEQIVELCGSVKKNETLPKYITEKEIKTYLSSKTDIKNKAIVSLLFYSMLRVSEVVNLDVADIKDNGIIIRETKGKKDAFIPFLCKRQKDILNEYMETYKPTTALFEGNEGRIKRNSIQVMVSRQLDINPHAMRHGGITALLEAGVDLFTIKEIARHATLETTQKYLHLTGKMLDKAKSVFDKEDE